MSQPLIRFEGVTKRFGDTAAVRDVDLTIEEGEFFALLGPSGCGKTTLLRMLAGFEVPSGGRILIDGEDVGDAPPNRRPVNMVFQSYAVFPHMSVAANVAYGLRMERVAAPERARRVEAALAQVQLDGLASRRPDQLSGGQRQRVALARALVKRPRVLLLDEPLSALDAKLRDQMRAELASLQHQVGITFVMVTHDQSEALALADRCALMNAGALAQVAAPAELYERPNSRFVADFIGAINLFEGRLTADASDHALVEAPDLAAPIYLDRGVADATPRTHGTPDGRAIWAALRPEKISLHSRRAGAPAPTPDDAPQGCNIAAGVVGAVSYLGAQSMLDVRLESGRSVKVVRANLTRSDQEDFAPQAPVWLSWRACSPALLLS